MNKNYFKIIRIFKDDIYEKIHLLIETKFISSYDNYLILKYLCIWQYLVFLRI